MAKETIREQIVEILKSHVVPYERVADEIFRLIECNHAYDDWRTFQGEPTVYKHCMKCEQWLIFKSEEEAKRYGFNDDDFNHPEHSSTEEGEK